MLGAHERVANGFCDELATILTPYRVGLEQEAALENRPVVAGETAMEARPAVIEERRHGCPIAVHYNRGDSEGCIMLGSQWTVSVLDDQVFRLQIFYPLKLVFSRHPLHVFLLD